jgi:hypothetical protein
MAKTAILRPARVSIASARSFVLHTARPSKLAVNARTMCLSDDTAVPIGYNLSKHILERGGRCLEALRIETQPLPANSRLGRA